MLPGLLAIAVVRIAVVGAGSDGRSVAALIRTTETRAADKSITVKPDAEVIAVVGRKSPPLDPALEKKVGASWAAAKEAFYTEHPQAAFDRLQEISTVYDRATGVPIAERVRLLLWRSAVLLDLDQKERAAAEARAALELAPDLTVDQTVFRPSVARLVDDLRASAPAASAPALDPVLERTILASAARGEPFGDERRMLDRLCDTLHVDAMALVAAKGDPASELRAVLWWRGGPGSGSAVTTATPDGAGATTTADWIVEKLLAGKPAVAVATPARTPAPTPLATSTPAPIFGSDAVLLASVGGVYANRTRVVDGGGSYGVYFNGAGPRLGLELRKGHFVAALGAEYVRWSFTRQPIEVTAGNIQNVDGGESNVFDGAAGWRIDLGSAGIEGASVTALAGLFAETILADDVRAAGGGRLGVFPEQRRAGLRLAAAGSLPIQVGLAAPLVAGLTLGLEPFPAWSERPAATTGQKPKGSIDPFAQISARMSFADRWRAIAQWEGSLRSAKFSGSGSAPLNPPITDAKLNESMQTLTLSLARSF